MCQEDLNSDDGATLLQCRLINAQHHSMVARSLKMFLKFTNGLIQVFIAWDAIYERFVFPMCSLG